MATSGIDVSAIANRASSDTFSALGNINSAIDRLYGIQAENNAKSLAFARQQQDWSAEQAEINRQFNASEAALSRDWQKMMSDTAHQREVRDLMAAGLNPILSATGGNGAAVTSGASASGVVASGASAQPDTSLNSAIVGILSKQLDTMASLASMATNAVTQSSIADKQNAVSRSIADITAGASMYNAGLASSASRYASELSSSAARYASDTSKWISENTSIPGLIVSALNSLLGEDWQDALSKNAKKSSAFQGFSRGIFGASGFRSNGSARKIVK